VDIKRLITQHLLSFIFSSFEIILRDICICIKEENGDEENMKMYRRTLNKNAVSAVIGVIIMVAITIAMAAVAYAYFTGMIGGQKTVTPTISFTPSAFEKTITVASADVDSNWNDINITFTNATGFAYLIKTGVVNAGDTIYLQTDQILRGTVTVIFRHVPTNSELGSYTIENV
jgi:flagellin-like protein